MKITHPLLILTVALFLASLPGGAAAQPKPAERELVAVLQFEAAGASAEHTSALTDRIRQRLLESGKFRLVEREMIDKILAEQALQQTGCTSTECAVQVGKILGVRKMINGKLTRVDQNEWVVSAAMADVETAETLRAASVTHEGSFLSLLETGTAKLLVRLVGQSGEGLSEILATAGVGRPKGFEGHSGLGFAYTPTQVSASLALSAGGSATLNLEFSGIAVSYLWALGTNWGVQVEIRHLIPSKLILPSDLGLPSSNFQDSGVLFDIYSLEVRYWATRQIHFGLRAGFATDNVHFFRPQSGWTDARSSSVDESGPIWYGSAFGASVGWHIPLGFMLDATYTSISVTSPGGVAQDRVSGLSLGMGFRF